MTAARAALATVVIALVWGCNWPLLKIAVTEMAPLTFRTVTLPFAALGMLLVARFNGDSLRVPRELRSQLATLSLFNVVLWNGFVLFGVQQLPAGRSSILAYTMPIWATAIGAFVLREPVSPRKLVGLVLGAAGMAVLLGEQIGQVRAAPFGAIMILLAAISWAYGTVLLRKWRPAMSQNALSGWMLLLGWVPLALIAPLFDAKPPTAALAELSPGGWLAVLYNIFLAGTLANLVWFLLARSLPVAVSSLASLPVPVIGVLSGMLVLGERPGYQEWIALALVLCALFTVLFQPKRGFEPPLMPRK